MYDTLTVVIFTFCIQFKYSLFYWNRQQFQHAHRLLVLGESDHVKIISQIPETFFDSEAPRLSF